MARCEEQDEGRALSTPQETVVSNLQDYWAAARAQKDALPAIYGSIDFDAMPERFTTDPAVKSTLGGDAAARAKVLADEESIELMRVFTFTGDKVADAYAALLPDYGLAKLVRMLMQACDKGVESVEDAPPELVTFIRSMEAKPDWIDMKLVEEGARAERNGTANLSPFLIRGAFLATFLNKYAALPMALTGTLSTSGSAHRVKETATFFATSVLPGALERFGAGFKSAAMVRLMHSTVRFNVMKKPGLWDPKVYGVPIPQVDQMPAGLIGIFLMAYELLAKGKTEFAPDQRARVELALYRCYLLGLPEVLLKKTPQGIADIMNARAATLRDGYDDATCGELVRATMAAELFKDDSLRHRIMRTVEPPLARAFFLNAFLGGDEKRAREIGVDVSPQDKLTAGVLMAGIMGRSALYRAASRLPIVSEVADAVLVRRIKRQLGDYGHAKFVSDESQYRPAKAPVPAE
jgi:hypothetical protein